MDKINALRTKLLKEDYLHCCYKLCFFSQAQRLAAAFFTSIAFFSFRVEQRRREDIAFLVLKMGKLCRFCKCPVAEGGLLLSEVDRDALSRWWSTCLHVQLDRRTLRGARSCRQCVWDARFVIIKVLI